MYNFFFIAPVYLQSVQNTVSKWEETETKGEEESSVALIHMEEAQGLETCIMPRYSFYPEDGGDGLLRNVGL
jgi:hypothetical protein